MRKMRNSKRNKRNKKTNKKYGGAALERTSLASALAHTASSEIVKHCIQNGTLVKSMINGQPAYYTDQEINPFLLYLKNKGVIGSIELADFKNYLTSESESKKGSLKDVHTLYTNYLVEAMAATQEFGYGSD